MKVLTRGASGVCVLALFALAMWFTNVKPHLDGKVMHPIIAHGRVGQVAGNRVFSIKVTRVDVASRLIKRDIPHDLRMTTPGVFVIVSLNARSNGRPVEFGHIRLVTRDGISYEESGRVHLGFLSPSFEPLLWRPAQFVFEIPKDRLAGARFIAGENTLINQLSAETEIDLGIDDGQAARLLSHPADYVVRPR